MRVVVAHPVILVVEQFRASIAARASLNLERGI